MFTPQEIVDGVRRPPGRDLRATHACGGATRALEARGAQPTGAAARHARGFERRKLDKSRRHERRLHDFR